MERSNGDLLLFSPDDSSDQKTSELPGERLVPIGAASDEIEGPLKETCVEPERMSRLEEEHERLSSSLLALSCHFAQVQFRLQQIRMAPMEDRERLLEELTEFSFQECPDIFETKRFLSANMQRDGVLEAKEKTTKELELIAKLRHQLDDLEELAYERGAGELPSSKLIEKQRAIIDHLQGMLPINLNQLDRLSSEELQREMDGALKKLVNPIKVKEQLVQQLQTQIVDLERFVYFLQGGNEGGGSSSKVARSVVASASRNVIQKSSSSSRSSFGALLSQISAMIQIYFLSQFGCYSSSQFHRNTLKQTSKCSHWGDLRATLQMSIDEFVNVCQRCNVPLSLPSESDTPREVLRSVRRTLCPSLRDLLSHGLLDSAKKDRRLLISRYCKHDDDFEEQPVHVWNVVERFYLLKHGNKLADAPNRTLSNAFQLDNLDGKAVTSRQLCMTCCNPFRRFWKTTAKCHLTLFIQVLLTTIDGILGSHVKLRRTNDAMFKAFVSAALNRRKLAPWLRMVFRCQQVMEECYASWSYICVVGIDETCKLLDRLSRFYYSLPVDLAVRPFTAMNDAF
ncbi:RUN domain containing protein [Trichuris trichiura]|uniref:RUN domain containing protein n=1 Tax=Trichuris trichiura TaxID=36087 RepID=A0A077Z0V6_TRITR|nr:RUN domain containing protein [Trichuris trichiura]